MTSPVWMGSPPEVHSALLSSGPGAASLQVSASAWTSLGAAYSSAADELTAVVVVGETETWEGMGAANYAAAHQPYVAWLMRNGAEAEAMAAEHEAMAAAYCAALAAMPTMGELAENHLTHGVLLGTNFFGINTVPIAVNEADYARMWVQAATTMSAYDAASTVFAARAPQTTPAPRPIRSLGDDAPNVLPQAANVLGSWSDFWEEFVYNFFDIFTYAWDSIALLGMDIGEYLGDPIGFLIAGVIGFFGGFAYGAVSDAVAGLLVAHSVSEAVAISLALASVLALDFAVTAMVLSAVAVPLAAAIAVPIALPIALPLGIDAYVRGSSDLGVGVADAGLRSVSVSSLTQNIDTPTQLGGLAGVQSVPGPNDAVAGIDQDSVRHGLAGSVGVGDVQSWAFVGTSGSVRGEPSGLSMLGAESGGLRVPVLPSSWDLSWSK
ncbi:PPE family protein [Mycobacterium liflandii 128FXT]|uniref:PPE family protein n=1 Tax=Mycobacterium liflandii (strain 128FXT) TaxID=459424 RepID=L7VG01_MYCL1|nr:PPE family protein [Mycobacterium liflandii]AGC64314.1 PPE family protein [Mycobacterium liflandii 128FXT]